MFEKEIKFIGDFCLNQVRNLGTIFTFEKISAVNIHPAILRYISAELDFMIYADRRKLLQQSYFDYSGKEISDHFQKISGEIKRTKKISSDDLKKLILQAVSFNVNYLVRPRWSLTKLIFNEQPIISVEELQMMLNYLYYYEYFRKVLSAYLSKRNLFQISLTEFDLILNKIDRELFSSNQEQLIDNALSSIGDFFNIGGVDKNLVPSTAVEIFLKEKNMLELVFKLRKEIPEGVKKRYDQNEFKRILYSPKSDEEHVEIKLTDSEIKIDGHEDLKIEHEAEEEPSLGEIADKYANELDKADIESFLSPEEEETLLSLYDEELKPPAEADTKSSFDQEGKDLQETDKSLESKVIDDEKISELIDLTEEEILSDKTDITDSTLEEVKNNNEPGFEESVESKSSVEQGVEKEIVEEMIRDYVGEESKEDIKEIVPKEDQPKLETLETELLNIFEDIDKFGEVSPAEENRVGEVKDTTLEESVQDSEEKPIASPEVDEIDEFLKSIDEIAFPGKKEKVKTEELKTEEPEAEEVVEEVVEEVQIKEEVKLPPKPVEARERKIVEKKIPEQEVKSTRPARQKDLFSYLKKKEIKKIITFIFSNDEEDFINTAERIMDCHSYKEASEILKAVFTSYKISPYSKEAITLTNGVSNYFRQA
jgi:hypothetical protein